MSTTIEQAKEFLSPPGDTIQETIDIMGMSQAELAERMGRPKEKVNDVIKGREPISTNTAFQLEKVLGIPASFWLNREKEYRRELFELEEQAFYEGCIGWLQNFPIPQMKKFGWLPNTREKHEQVVAMLKFFGVATPDEWTRIYVHEEVSVAFRVSLANTQNPHAVSAWLRMGELQAKQLNVLEFDKKRFRENLFVVKELAFEQPEDFDVQLQKICATCGVALVYTPNLPKAPISGATRWFHNKPIIQLSGRFKTDDHFWFTFFHEAGHIILHGKKDIFLENLEGTEIDQEKEDEANTFAAKMLVHQMALKAILNSFPLNEQKILEVADMFEIPPGVIVGRLQHMGYLPYHEFNNLKRKINLFNY
ncbi:ImmA/IrrE family metallo-endopeptidase [Arenibacter algicola]|uniref:ImmA/IrrE family metallo-endopeptidase n=1 Tax=Arenibacter algicola TaxID=616991 RepID=UPI0004DF8AA6|nr:ImmA/IrrE family metallo-endopeptidase [Arenibacter algicola]